MKKRVESRGLPAALAAVVLLAGMAGACGGDDDDGGVETTLFPANYAESYVEVRDCRRSGDHDLNYVRVLADPAALAPYQERDSSFPEGAVVLKVEYDAADVECADEVTQWTVMSKLAAGSAEAALDWRWQQVDADRTVESENENNCIACHSDCVTGPIGFDGTCAEP